MANTTERTSVSLFFSKAEKHTAFSTKNTSEPIGKGFPKNYSTENDLISNPDVEEIVDLLMVEKIISFNVCPLYSSAPVTINYKEAYHMQFHPDIVPPPPKV